ncbi:MAG: abortive infection system antitoxin AbiGi family protein [Syntrophales bacterium]
MEKATIISANTLFHFTSNIDNLIGILTNNFYPRYCLEDYSVFYTKDMAKRLKYSNIAIPMVCFCDIPLSSIRNHINVYGRYAIGLSKEWGKKKHISPVMYALSNSISSKVIRKSLSTIEKCIHKSNKHLETLYSNNPTYKQDKKDKLIDILSNELARVDSGLLDIMAFTKNYKGTFLRNGKQYRNVCFYDEREWRYVPDERFLFELEIPFHIRKEECLDANRRRNADLRLERRECMLKFGPPDIRYIIVGKHEEILPMVDSIHQIKGNNYSDNDLRLLTTRIISMEQILQDF